MANNVYKQRGADDAGRIYGISFSRNFGIILIYSIRTVGMAELNRTKDAVINSPSYPDGELVCPRPTEEGKNPDVTVLPTPEPLQIKVNSEHHVYLIVNEKEIHGTEKALAIDSESVSDEEGEKENENGDNPASSEKAYSTKTFDDDLTNKVKLIINIEGFKEAGGEWSAVAILTFLCL